MEIKINYSKVSGFSRVKKLILRTLLNEHVIVLEIVTLGIALSLLLVVTNEVLCTIVFSIVVVAVALIILSALVNSKSLDLDYSDSNSETQNSSSNSESDSNSLNYLNDYNMIDFIDINCNVIGDIENANPSELLGVRINKFNEIVPAGIVFKVGPIESLAFNDKTHELSLINNTINDIYSTKLSTAERIGDSIFHLSPSLNGMLSNSPDDYDLYIPSYDHLSELITILSNNLKKYSSVLTVNNTLLYSVFKDTSSTLLSSSHSRDRLTTYSVTYDGLVVEHVDNYYYNNQNNNYLIPIIKL